MMLLKPLAILCFIAVWACMPSAFVDRRILCSSEKFNIWYTYDGPLYYLSMRVSPCSLGVSQYNVTYTIIPMFTIARFGYHAAVYYKGVLWLEHTQSSVPCEDAKICDIIKGETLFETFPLYMKKMYSPEGEYQVYLTVTVIDDLQGMLALRFNITCEVKNAAGGKNLFFPQIELH